MDRCVSMCDALCVCGEAPLWLQREQHILWVDTDSRNCFTYDTAAQTCTAINTDGYFQTIAHVAATDSISECTYIAVLNDRVALCRKDLSIMKDLGNPLAHKPSMILGDGTAGPDGCFYFGAFNSQDLYAKEGVVLRVNRDLSIEIVAEGFALPNGLAFNASGDTFYVTEMFANRIHAFDVSAADSSLSNCRVFTDIPQDQGMPDGLIIDAEGFLWSAHWQGFRITRYDPDGTVERVVPVPVPTPTCLAFGGSDMTTLYITTARKGLSEQQLKDYPHSGELFCLNTDIVGRAELECRFL